MKKILLTLGVVALCLPMLQAQDDDIYFNPKKTTSSQQKKKNKKSYYIKDFSSMDVDEYNRRGEMYYETPVDTIGAGVENGQDFVYTQQIQKYYNPTIVLDNANLLEDVLNNSYGNVEVVINNNGYPTFAPYSAWNYWGPGYYSAWGPSWTWGPAWTWNSWAWNWGPAWTWGWGPSWTWNPYWNYGPGWGWGPSWGWGGGWNYPFYAHGYRRNPNAGRPSQARPGWGGHTRPGYNYAGNSGHNGGYGRPSRNPGSSSTSSGTRPVYTGNRRGYNSTQQAVTGTNTVRGNRSYSNNSGSVNKSNTTTGNRSYGTSNRSYGTSNRVNGTNSMNSSSRSYNRSQSTQRSTQQNTYRQNNSNSNSSRSYGGGSYGGGFGGGSRSGGSGGGGGHRR